jgi:hypothetical protein
MINNLNGTGQLPALPWKCETNRCCIIRQISVAPQFCARTYRSNIETIEIVVTRHFRHVKGLAGLNNER